MFLSGSDVTLHLMFLEHKKIPIFKIIKIKPQNQSPLQEGWIVWIGSLTHFYLPKETKYDNEYRIV